jgi:hypothetical protein
MAQYLLSVYQPDDVLPKPELDKVMARVGAWHDQVVAAGAWVFDLGLHPASSATVVRSKGGEALLTDGPYVEGKEHIGGFTIVQADDLDAAIAWGAGLAEATGLPIEVRPMHG